MKYVVTAIAFGPGQTPDSTRGVYLCKESADEALVAAKEKGLWAVRYPLLTSESLKAQDGDGDNFHYQFGDTGFYQLTKGEEDWLFNFVRGRYCIADHILNSSFVYENENEDEYLIYEIDPLGMGEALTDDDSFPKAVMLSDDSALQAIFFHSAVEPTEDE